MLETPLSCPEPQMGEDVRLTARSRAEVLAQVAIEVAAPCPELDAAVIEAALQAREEEASTELGCGMAMPHAVLAGLSEPRMLNVAFEQPVQWGEVRRCVVILVPPGRERAHLELVAQAVRAHEMSPFE
jgi:PTS system nitrogen regulatory IIA component